MKGEVGVKIIGAFFMIIALILWITALPTMTQAVDTRAGHTLENESTTNKQFYSFYDTMFAIMPYLIFALGFGVAWKG